MDEWRTDMPESGRTVLVVAHNSRTGRRTIIRAIHLEKYAEEITDFNDAYEPMTDYDEENDVYYCAEGWYEQIDYWDDPCSVYVDDPVTHWQPLPRLPAKENAP